jgi:hypothetical protein
MAQDNAIPAAIARLSPESLRALVGDAEVAHLASKGRGGSNGYKGLRFEHFFGAHRIARLARKYLEQGDDAVVEWQTDGFVDDVVVRRDVQRSFKGYQLKNAQAVSWTAGKRSIERDFEVQHEVCASEGYADIRLRLVCSDAEIAAARRLDVPAGIAGFASSIYFPYLENVRECMSTLRDHEWLIDDFAYLSREQTPKTIDVSQVVGVLMGAWDLLAPKASISAIVEQARTTSPTLIRPFRTDEEARAQLSGAFCDTLSAWADFSYCIVRGFLTWSAFGGSMTGTLSFDCFHPSFAGWQKHIADSKPATFAEVEGIFV